MELSPGAVRALHLAAQGLLAPGCGGATKDDVLATIRRMGALQIDAINVVTRSQYLVLWSRLGRYDPAWLDELLAEGRLFEYWAHAACFLPSEDYPLFRRGMLDGARWANTWLAEHPDVVGRVLAHIRERGGVQAADFARADGRSGGWWDWKPEKAALEALHTAGEVMIARREGFQRVYDLRERVLPGWDDAATPCAASARRELVLRAVRALGAAPARWVHDYYRLPRRPVAATLTALAAEGALCCARVAGWDEPVYLHPDHLALAEAAHEGALAPGRTTLLSPFDPLVWDRARAEELFGFAYRIEVYTPAARRRYGYYTLPILHGDRLVGRVDPKAERRQGRLVARAVHLEPGVATDDALLTGLAGALRDLAGFLATPEVVVERTDPAGLLPALRDRLARCE
ncbi:MAG TPA: crosslink repair DNA glycosylase YcaQ family protein [Thermomicrobiales bacterium]|nr:crosslink repair DNA glycosylase YcaQ family protein [Thermomicrobiales bacterium]